MRPKLPAWSRLHCGWLRSQFRLRPVCPTRVWLRRQPEPWAACVHRIWGSLSLALCFRGFPPSPCQSWLPLLLPPASSSQEDGKLSVRMLVVATCHLNWGWPRGKATERRTHPVPFASGTSQLPSKMCPLLFTLQNPQMFAFCILSRVYGFICRRLSLVGV